MENKYSEQDFRRLLSQDITESDVMNGKIQEAYRMVRNNGRKQKKWHSIAAVMTGTAAALAIGFGYCVANPVWAAKLPVIGNIFQSEERDVSYQGDYSTKATQVKKDGKSYSQESNGVTFTVSECYADSMAMYLAVNIESEEAFPDEFIENIKNTDLSYEVMQMDTTAAADFTESGLGKVVFDPSDGIVSPYVIEGHLTGNSEFSGIIRVDLTNIPVLDQDGNVDYIPAAPKEFSYELNVSSIYTVNNDGAVKIAGDWSFELPVRVDDSQLVELELNKTNEDGIGIGKVRKSAYEIQAELVLPKGYNRFDYVVVITDANGNRLESRGDEMETYNVWQEDMSTATIAVCDYDTFMEYKMDMKTLLSKAVFQTEVSL